MQGTSEGTTDLIGKLGNGILRKTFLVADENKLYLHTQLKIYTFSPNEVISIEESGDLEVRIIHTRLDYPAEITFTSVLSAPTTISKIVNKGFIPSASIEALPNRDRFIFRIEAITLIGLIVILSLYTGDFGIRFIFREIRVPIFATLTIFIIRFFPSFSQSPFNRGDTFAK